MQMSKITLSLLALFFLMSLHAANSKQDKIRILLMGDSTTEGGRPVFETSIEALLTAQAGMPGVEVINVGLGGETAHSLMESGRYDSQISHLKDIDYIFFRYGINDWFHRLPVEEHFRADVKKVIHRLRADFPGARIILMTILPFLEESQTKRINDYIYQISQEEGLELFDIYPLYLNKIQELGENSMNVRFFPLGGIPEIYHNLLKPYTKFYAWKDAEWVRVQSNEFDPLLGHLPNWYLDHHPNTTGYRFLADQTVKYLLPRLQSEFLTGVSE